jgi:hypothetical protein
MAVQVFPSVPFLKIEVTRHFPVGFALVFQLQNVSVAQRWLGRTSALRIPQIVASCPVPSRSSGAKQAVKGREKAFAVVSIRGVGLEMPGILARIDSVAPRVLE